MVAEHLGYFGQKTSGEEVPVSQPVPPPSPDPAPVKMSGSLARTPDGLADVVYLPYEVAGPFDRFDDFGRELDRQALWLAAREEFGLRPKDASLGDPAPAGLPSDRFIRVRTGNNSAIGLTRIFSIGSTGYGSMVWVGKHGDVRFYRAQPARAIEDAEAVSRGRFKDCLAAARFVPKENARSDAPVSPEVERLLGEMRETSQFAAVRMLHDEVRTKGESPALLGGLARGYATLGLLTEFHWTPAPYAFKARGLLYAQRVLARNPTSPTALRTRAYVAALTGLHQLALADLERAGPGPAPAWVEAVDAFVHFDLGRLAKAGDTPLVGLLTYLAREEPEAEAAMIGAAARFLKTEPECYRVHDALARLMGVANGHQATTVGLEAFTAGLPRRIREQPGLPGAVADLVTRDRLDSESEADLYDALRAAGKPTLDRGEPSWTALGSILRDVRFSQAWYRLYFMAVQWGVPTADAAREFATTLAGHPLLPVIESFVVDRQRDPAAVRAKLTAVAERDFDIRAGWYSNWCDLADPTGKLRGEARAQNSHGYQDVARWLYSVGDQDNYRAKYGAGVRRVSPHAPLGAALLASARPDPGDPGATEVADAAALAEIEKTYPESPTVQRRLAQRYSTDGRFDDAERCFRRWVELSPDGRAYREMAAVYLKQGKEELWKKALEDSLKQEDHGLDHAQSRVDLARFYMNKKDFERAEPYALAAAESYAEWALLCAAQCKEGLGKWDEANEIYRASSQRYEGSVFPWYFGCRQSGRMQRSVAEEAVATYLASFEGKISPNWAWSAGRFYLLTGRPKLAREQFAAEYVLHPTPACGLFVALLADAAKDIAERDRMFNEIAKMKDDHLKKLAVVLQRWAASKEAPDAAAVEAALAGYTPGERSDASTFVGWWLDNRGAADRAVEVWEKGVALKTGTLWLNTHAKGFLEDHGVKR
ncbi:hypothetical protein FRUB_08561 [Fimbriiglobus ruber]|uniref:Uncharacterized protein n=2 Tax=Fimbriiglobus ruber TaxID=1908690 RepID=A0A225DBU4_9BACT|nr:hypothetical protein FRUB_08561 [Fimbriiglobus ruber]